MSVRKIENFPYEIKDVDRETSEELMKIFTGVFSGFVQVGPKGYFMRKRYEEEAADIYNFQLRSDDTFVLTYPRSGTTWTQEFVWLIENNLDYARAAEIDLHYRFPFLESTVLIDHVMIQHLLEEKRNDKHIDELVDNIFTPQYTNLAKLPSPRFIKSHLALSLLPPSLLDTCKVVFVARDPRDVAVSFYHFNRLIKIHGYIVVYTPVFDMIKEAWEKRTHPNMLFLFYEELSKDLPAAIRKVCEFFGKEYSEEQIAKLSGHLHISNFKKNKSVNAESLLSMGFANEREQPYIRNGNTGGWRDYFDAEMTAQAERWIADNLRDTDLRFPTDYNQDT